MDWCPRNPDMLATAFFDGTVGIHSIQSTNELPGGPKDPAPRLDGTDIFDLPSLSSSSQSGTLSLKQPPKWLRRPASSAFGFGGKLITVSNLTSSQHLPPFLRRPPLKSVPVSLLTQLVPFYQRMVSPLPLRQVYSEMIFPERAS